MMKMCRGWSTAAVVLCALAWPLDAAGCLCSVVLTRGETSPLRPRSERSVVFVGTAMEVDTFEEPYSGRVLFAVEAVWRGAVSDTATLSVGPEAPCALYIAGGRYLVYADRRGERLVSGQCDDAWPIGHPVAREWLAELGPPSRRSGALGTRTIDADVTPVGEPPGREGRTAFLGLSTSGPIAASRIDIADRVWQFRDDLPEFTLPEGLYRMRVVWSDGEVSETNASVRCEGDDSLDRCFAFRYLADLRETLPGGLEGSGATPQQPPLEFSCAAFPPELTEADLVSRYGAQNVTTGPVQGMDDGPVEGTVVFPESEEARLEVQWWDTEGRARPYSVFAIGSGWTMPGGIRLGVDLRTVETMNGRPFRLAGFWTEMQGGVRSWSDGRLERPDPEGCRPFVHFQPPYDGSADFTFVRQVRSGQEYSSGHPALQGLNPKVVVMRLSYPPARVR